MVISVIRGIWGQKMEMPKIESYDIKPTQGWAICDILYHMQESGVGDGTVETAEGGLLGCLLPNGQIFNFCPN